MHKLLLVVLCSCYLYASYNPFFSEPAKKQTPPPQPEVNTIVKEVYKAPPKLDIDLLYYGFVQAENKNFALLKMKSKSFAISEGDSFYVQNQQIKVVKINSNQVVVKSPNRYQTFYFSRGE